MVQMLAELRHRKGKISDCFEKHFICLPKCQSRVKFERKGFRVLFALFEHLRVAKCHFVISKRYDKHFINYKK